MSKKIENREKNTKKTILLPCKSVMSLNSLCGNILLICY